jgi:hypothetical protein
MICPLRGEISGRSLIICIPAHLSRVVGDISYFSYNSTLEYDSELILSLFTTLRACEKIKKKRWGNRLKKEAIPFIADR